MSVLLPECWLLIFFLNGIIRSFVSEFDVLRSKSGSLFSFTSVWMAIHNKLCLSKSVTTTKSEPMSWFIDYSVIEYSKDF